MPRQPEWPRLSGGHRNQTPRRHADRARRSSDGRVHGTPRVKCTKRGRLHHHSSVCVLLRIGVSVRQIVTDPRCDVDETSSICPVDQIGEPPPRIQTPPGGHRSRTGPLERPLQVERLLPEIDHRPVAKRHPHRAGAEPGSPRPAQHRLPVWKSPQFSDHICQQAVRRVQRHNSTTMIGLDGLLGREDNDERAYQSG